MISKLKEALKDKKLIFGTERTLKGLKLGEINTVFLASNCSEKIRDEIKKYDVEVIELEEPSEEIAMICKRPNPIAVLSY